MNVAIYYFKKETRKQQLIKIIFVTSMDIHKNMIKEKITIFAMTTSASFSNEMATSSKIGASFLQCPHQGA